MSLLETRPYRPTHPDKKSGVEHPRREVIFSSSVFQAFLGYAHMEPGEEAMSKLRKILKRTREVTPKNTPNHLKCQKGVKPAYFAHPSKPEIVYMGWEVEGVRHISKVIIYDKEGRPSYKQY